MQSNSGNNPPSTTQASSSGIPTTAPATTSIAAPTSMSTTAPSTAPTAGIATAATSAPPPASAVLLVPTAGARVYHAIAHLNQLPNTLRRAAEEASASQRHWAELESWLEDAQPSIDSRSDSLHRIIGSENHPSNAARLPQLLQPFPVPSNLLNPVSAPVPAASGSKRKRSSTSAQAVKKGKGKAVARDSEDEGGEQAKTSAAQAQGDESDEQGERREPREGEAGSSTKQKKPACQGCPAVVYDNSSKRYVELRCDVCGTNTSGESNFLRGLTGFQRHYDRAHQQTRTVQQMLSSRGERDFSEDEALQVNQPGGITVSKRRADEETEGGQGGASGASGAAGEGQEAAEGGEASQGEEVAEGSEDE